MRKFSYLLVVLFSFFMLSCSRDEDNKTNVPAQPQQLDNVVGSWALVEMRMKGNITVGGGSPTPIDIAGSAYFLRKKDHNHFSTRWYREY